ncbi:MAG: hypothetical protein K8H86_06440 [Ignavibacteriaceae bacterium]|nr:hypothetical protein [Ignavibacteriaceae bacterium]
MMKVIAIFFVLLLSNPSRLFAQEDSVDTSVPNLIIMQVMETRQIKHDRLLGEKIKNTLPVVTPKENKVKSAKIESSGGITTKFILLASASVVVFLFVFIRRMKLTKNSGGNVLRKNVKLIREEKIIRLNDPRLKKTRVRIARNEINFNYNEVSQLARQLNISKGELQLAARLKQGVHGRVNNNILV